MERSVELGILAYGAYGTSQSNHIALAEWGPVQTLSRDRGDGPL
jgi:hypothetical protein